ncbi:MAG: IS5 family transposase [Bacteroidota bacterium]
MKQYQSDLTDSQWKVIQKFFDVKRKRKHPLRQILNAILYLVKSGCQWRMLPANFAPWQTVYYYFRRWKQLGYFEEIHDTLVSDLRVKKGKSSSPSVGIIDSQSVKITGVGGHCIGYDAGKKIKGRKRHLIVDTLGLIIGLEVHGANEQDRNAGRKVVGKLKFKFPRLQKIYADGGYSGSLIDFVMEKFGWIVEIVKRSDGPFKILPKRWIVERTFSWLNWDRRNSKDYEYLTESS